MPDFRYSNLSFVKLSGGRTTDKLAITRKNFAQVGFQLKLLLEYGCQTRLTDSSTC